MRSTDPSTLRIIDLWSFRSLKSNKRYIVEIEHFSNNFLGLKFYWKGVSDCKERYSYLTYDYEPRTIVMSCIMIMLDYFRNDNCISFGFVAAPNLNDPLSPNKRFRFYRRMMLSIFGEQTFAQGYDVKNSIYILINRKMLDSRQISLSKIEKEINNLYEGDFSIVIE